MSAAPYSFCVIRTQQPSAGGFAHRKAVTLVAAMLSAGFQLVDTKHTVTAAGAKSGDFTYHSHFTLTRKFAAGMPEDKDIIQPAMRAAMDDADDYLLISIA